MDMKQLEKMVMQVLYEARKSNEGDLAAALLPVIVAIKTKTLRLFCATLFPYMELLARIAMDCDSNTLEDLGEDIKKADVRIEIRSEEIDENPSEDELVKELFKFTQEDGMVH